MIKSISVTREQNQTNRDVYFIIRNMISEQTDRPFLLFMHEDYYYQLFERKKNYNLSRMLMQLGFAIFYDMNDKPENWSVGFYSANKHDTIHRLSTKFTDHMFYFVNRNNDQYFIEDVYSNEDVCSNDNTIDLMNCLEPNINIIDDNVNIDDLIMEITI